MLGAHFLSNNTCQGQLLMRAGPHASHCLPGPLQFGLTSQQQAPYPAGLGAMRVLVEGGLGLAGYD